jgi:hypothetical protein
MREVDRRRKDAPRLLGWPTVGDVAFWGVVRREHVLRAIGEYDRLGQDEFLERNGFGRARVYLLWYDGRPYDSKAILGVAYRYATGIALGAHDFNGGKYGAAAVLRRMNFHVDGG